MAHVIWVDQLAEPAFIHSAGRLCQFENLEIRSLTLLHSRLQRHAISSHQLRLGRICFAVAIGRANHDHGSPVVARELYDRLEILDVLRLRNTRHRRAHTLLRWPTARTVPTSRVRKRL